MTTLPRSLFALALLLPPAALSAQNLLVYRPGGAVGQMNEYPTRSRAFRPVCTLGLVPGPYAGPARPFAGHPRGACCVDNTTGVVYTTNGVNSIQLAQYPRIGSFAAAVIPSLPIPAAVGQVTGMAVDPVTKNLFLTNGALLFEVDPSAGMAVVWWGPAAPLNILAGLEFDPAQPNLIFAVSTVAEIGTYIRGGGFVGFVAPGYAPPSVAVGLGLDQSGPAGGDFYVLHATGEIVHYPTSTVHAVMPADQVGMVFLPSKVELPSAGLCAGVTPNVSTSTLVFDGSAGFGLELDGLLAGTPGVLWAIDVLAPGAAPGCLAGAGFGCGDTLWLPGAPTLLFAPVAGTSSVLPLPLPPGFAGWSLIAQPVVPCPGCALGFVLPNAMQLEISRD